MSTQVELIEKVNQELETLRAEAAAREADLFSMLARTTEHWKAWSERWAAVLKLLEERRAVLETKESDASDIVAVAEDRLQDTEAALREWLATAARLASRLRAEN